MTLTDREYQRMRDVAIGIIRERRSGHGWLQHPVRHRSCQRPDDRDRDEPARLAIIGLGIARRPVSRLPRSLPSWPSATASTRSRTTSPSRLRPVSSRPWTTSSSRSPRSPSRSSQRPTPTLTTHMKSVGEAMAIGRNFTEALGKALRSLEDPTAPFDFTARSPTRLRSCCSEPRAHTMADSM